MNRLDPREVLNVPEKKPFNRVRFTRTPKGGMVVMTSWENSWKVRQDASLATAHRNGHTWTEDEKAVARDSTLTHLQVARKINRSAYAVKGFRRKDAERIARELEELL